MYNPRILISNVPAWNNSTGSDTMSSLLDGYDKDKLACLYVKADRSDSITCDRYFHILEGRVIKSILKRNLKTGEEYVCDRRKDSTIDTHETIIERERIMRFRAIRPAIILLGRELLWKLGKWNSKELNAFLDGFRPEVFFFPIESYIYFNRINEYIIKHCKPQKVVGYLWDDNFTYKQDPYGRIFSKLNRWWLRCGVKRLVQRCDTVFAICPKMKRECDDEFGIDSVLLTKPITNSGEFKSYVPSSPIKIVYTGKLIIGRDETIAKIVKALQDVNKDGVKAQLHIYSQTELNLDIKARINFPNSCVLHGAVSQTEIAAIQKSADVLLFAESMSDRKPIARLSFSTKLTDYFSAGKCIWAVGFKDLASIEYLKEMDAGLVSTDEESIKAVLESVVNVDSLILEYAQKAYNCGVRHHNYIDIKNKLNEALGI